MKQGQLAWEEGVQIIATSNWNVERIFHCFDDVRADFALETGQNSGDLLFRSYAIANQSYYRVFVDALTLGSTVFWNCWHW